jgi:nitroreductase
MSSPASSPAPQSDAEVLARVIRERRTTKWLADLTAPVVHSAAELAHYDAIVREAVSAGGWAPFHYDRGVDGLAEPWRFYWLGESSCRRLARAIPELVGNLKPSNKLPALLAGCGSLVLATWLPQTTLASSDEETTTTEKLAAVNREHLCATAAAVQNVLLMLTAHGLDSYWSTGAILAVPKVWKALGISADEQLAAAVFVGYPGATGGEVERAPGKLYSRRSPAQAWFRELRF